MGEWIDDDKLAWEVGEGRTTSMYKTLTVKQNGVYRQQETAVRDFFGQRDAPRMEGLLAARHNPNPFNVGDRVGYNREFLQLARMKPGHWSYTARGTVIRIDGMLCVIDWSDGAPQNAVSSTSLMLERKIKR